MGAAPGVSGAPGGFEMGSMPPQRGGRRPQSGPGRGASAQNRNLTPAQGAQEAEGRLGRPCFHAGQSVVGTFGCVACQFQIRNRAVLPTCPECGEMVWCFMEDGPRPVPEGETASAQAPVAPKAPAAIVQDNVSLEATPVRVEEGVNLEP